VKRKLRRLLYGPKPHVYRVIYEVDEPRQTVRVLTIRQQREETTKSFGPGLISALVRADH
jgi:mRNA-degrading endonuclease RelE of RelBE toxin-antitoxin system